MMLRRLRAVLVTASLWAVGWAILASILVTIQLLIQFDSPNFFGGVLPLLSTIAVLFGGLGAIAGAIYAVVLMIAERRGSFDQLSTWRMALYGAAPAAVAIAIGIVATTMAGKLDVVSVRSMLTTGSLYAGIGAALAVSQLKVAQRAVTGVHQPKLIDAPPS
ncbi:MAG TPA: hypothetical protein VFN22_07085 [Gemmatimonadales bacterium]|nr:hypothetical protein [Gemmatimonadales bacterium]